MQSFSTTLTPEQLPFIVSRLANANVRRMVEERGPAGTLKALIADEKQHRTLMRIIDEEFGLMPTVNDVKVGSWAQFIEAKHHRIVIGEVKSVTRQGIKVKEYNDMGNRLGWAPTGTEWTVMPDLINEFIQIPAKMTVEQKQAAKAAEKKAEEAKAAKATKATVKAVAKASKTDAAKPAAPAKAPKADAAKQPAAAPEAPAVHQAVSA